MRGWKSLRVRVLATAFLPVALACGCNDRPPEERARRIGLIEIGERALETGVRLEESGLSLGAAEAYERAVWAFSYHERLTGQTPLLMDEAEARLTHARTDHAPLTK